MLRYSYAVVLASESLSLVNITSSTRRPSPYCRLKFQDDLDGAPRRRILPAQAQHGSLNANAPHTVTTVVVVRVEVGTAPTLARARKPQLVSIIVRLVVGTLPVGCSTPTESEQT
jgi:hypothetical protein